MVWFGHALMLAVTASWIAARQSGQRAGEGLEWMLLSVLPATAALLAFLAAGDTAAALSAWLTGLALAALAVALWPARRDAVLRRRPAWAVSLVAVLAAGLFSGPVRAQAEAAPLPTIPVDAVESRPEQPPPAAPAPAAPLEEIVVTGEKLGRSLNETATSVGIVTREELEASSNASMKDVATQFGNVVSAAGDREIAIRGIPLNGIGGEGQTISLYLDGVALPSRASFAGPLSTWDLEQVEVLRGAQSTNQGVNSLAGSVVLRSRDPTPHWDARLRAGLMSRDGHDYAFAGGGPLGDTLAFRVAAQDRYDNGDIVNLTRGEDDAGRERTRNLRAKLAWTPEALPGYRAQYGYTQADNEFGDPLHDASQGARTETSNVRGNEDDRTRLHSLEQRYGFGDNWRIDAISGFADFDNLYTIDYDRSAADGGHSDNTTDERVFSQELRLHYDGPSLNAVVGAYYADTDTETATLGYDVAAAGGLVLMNGTIASDRRLETAALFAEADWDFAAAWRLTAGLRLNREHAERDDVSDMNYTITAAVPGLPPTIPIGVPLPDVLSDALSAAFPGLLPPDYTESGRTRYTDLLPKLGLTWFPGESSALSLSYQEGYRSGGTSVSFFGGAVSPFEPEYTRTLELAARSRWFQERLTLNANVFYTRWRDQQVTIGETSGFETTTANAGRSHYYGLEAEALWRFDAPFEVFATLGLLDTEFDDFVNQDEDYAGNEFPYAPRHTLGLGLTMREWNRLSAQLGANYIGSLYSDADNDPRSRAGSRTLVNARIAYRLPAGWTVAVFGRNLTGDTNEQGALVSGSRLASRYGEPRSYGAVVEWQL